MYICLRGLSHIGKVLKYTRFVCQDVTDVLIEMLVTFPQKYWGLCEIFRFQILLNSWACT